MNHEDDLTPGVIANIAWDVSEASADPEDVKRVLAYFCSLVDEGKQLPIEMQDFLKDGFRRFLKDEATSVDQGLGLVRSKTGRPKADEDKRRQMAAYVLRERLSGKAHQEVLEDVAEEFGVSASTVGDAWSDHNATAPEWLLAERVLVTGQGSFSEEETRRLQKIYAKRVEKMARFFADQPPTITPKN